MYQTDFDAESKIWSGRKLVGPLNPNITVGQAVLWVLQGSPNQIGQISHDSGVQLTNNEIRLRIIRTAQNITSLGFKEDDVFTIIARNSENLAPLVFGSMAIGCPVNTLDPSFGRFEITHMLEIAKPKLVFCDLDKLDVVRESLEGLDLNPMIFTFGGATEFSRNVSELLAETECEEDFVPLQIEDGVKKTAAIVCSSGTTGAAKGVCLSHASLMDRLVYFLPLSADDVAICYSSLYWLSGIAVLVSCTLSGSTRVITTDPFTAESYFEKVDKYKITFMLGPPIHLSMIQKSSALDAADLTSMKYYVLVGSKLPVDLYEEMGKYFPNCGLYGGFGMSEVSGMVTLNYPEPRPASVGKLSHGTQIKIVNDEGANCGIQEDGEICYRANRKFKGYFGDSKTTDEAFDIDGWFLTGDIGYFDEDGFLYIVDRKKDLLKYRNFQVMPSEIEDILIRHPAVKQVTVIGIPDPESTDLPAAVIVKHDDFELTEDEVAGLVAENLADAKRLRGGVYFVDKLPMTPSGKVIKRLVKEEIIKIFNGNV